MDYQIVLPRNLHAADFVANWNESPECRAAAVARVEPAPPAAYDPLMDAAFAVLGKVGTGIAANLLYDLIKQKARALLFDKHAEAAAVDPDDERHILIVDVARPDGTRILFVKIDEE